MSERGPSSPRRSRLVLVALALLLSGLALRVTAREQPQPADGPKAAAKLELRPGDHVCVIGNTLADRMQHDGWLETLLQSRFPKHQLVVRDLGFSGDEAAGYTDRPDINRRLRSMDAGTADQWLAGSAPVPQPKKLTEAGRRNVRADRFELTNTKADVIFAFFGYNESFAGPAGLDKFKSDFDRFVKHTLAQKYNGKSAPRLVVFSPIAHENLRDRNLPDGSENNKRLALYTAAMAEVAGANGVTFVDLFGPTQKLYADAPRPLTINGVHLNEEGNRQVARLIVQTLFPQEPGASRDPSALEKLRQAVLDKNLYFYNHYRATDGYSTFGDRAFLTFQPDRQSNYEVVQRELEVLDVMAANRDKRIWAVAQGGDLKVDDANIPPFIPVTTNKPGPLPGGKHVFLGGEEAIGKMTAAKGYKVNLFADEKMFPELVNPVQTAWDPKGRLWVAVWPTYPHWKPTEEMNDKLLILEDTDGDGKADKCSTFAGNLHNPTGFEFYNGGVLVAQAPDLVFLKDTDGDDKADVRTRVLHGLDTADTHHTSNSFVLDPGGALYFQEGTFHRTQVETAHGPPQRCANAGVFRYEPRAQKFDVYVSFGFANPHGHVFDRWGQDIVVDGTGSDPYHAALFSGHLDFPLKHPKPPTVYAKWTRPCPGMEYLSSRHFPESMQGNLLVGNVIGFLGILQYKIQDKGASFAGTEVERLLSSTDQNFRPSDFKIGPDGALYFLDWHNPIIGHMQHNLRDPSRDREHGRIYRFTAEGRPLLKPARIAGEPIEKLLDLLKEPEDRVRYRAKIELGARDTDQVIAAVNKWVAALDKNDPEYEHHRLEALWVHQYHNVVDAGLLRMVLSSPDFRARAAATRVLCYWRDRVPEALDLVARQAADAHPRVRLEAVRALSFFDDPKALAIVVDSLAQPTDEYLRFVIRETTRALEQRFGVTGRGEVGAAIARLLGTGKAPADRVPGLVEALSREGAARDLRVIWDQASQPGTYPPALRRQALDWLADAAAVRKVKPTGDLSAVAELIAGASSDPALQAAAVRLASAWGVVQAAPALRQLAAGAADADVQQAAIEGLAQLGDADSRKLVTELAGSGRPARVRFLATAALAAFDLDAAAQAAAAALAAATGQDDPAPLLDAFLNRKGGADKLAAALNRTKPGADPARRGLRHLYLSGRSDAALSDVLTAAAGITTNPKPPTGDDLKRLITEVQAKGDPARGEQVFRRADLGCIKCHAVSKAGGNVGPELSAVGGSSPVDYVLAAILDPNAAVKEEYMTKVIGTQQGLLHTGIVVERDGSRVVLKDANGKLVRIPTGDITEEDKGNTLMPEGLTKFLTHAELLDLARFVSELGKPGPYAVRTTPTVQRWRVLTRPDAALTRGVPSDNAIQQHVQGAPADAWQSAYGMVNGVLPLAELKKGPGTDVLILQGEMEVSSQGRMNFDLQCDSPVQVWIDGRRTAPDELSQVPLRQGRHTITLRVEAGAKPGGLKLEVQKPVGSAAQFEVVNGT